MKIVIVVDNDIISDSRILKAAACLQKKHDVQLLGLSSAQYHGREIDYNGTKLRVTYVASMPEKATKIQRLLRYIMFQLKVSRWLHQHREEYDVVHASHLSTAWISELSVAKRHKVVFDVPDYFTDSRRFIKPLKLVIKKIETYFLNHADAVILASEERVRQIEPASPKKLVIVVNSPELPSHFRNPKSAKSDKKIRIVYIGGLTPYRMLPELLAVVKMDERLLLEIGGSGVLEKEVRQAAQVCNRIHFLGRMPYEQVLKTEQKADILTALYDPIIDNHQYASPNKFFEAMALGKPVIMVAGTGMAINLLTNNYGAVISEISQSALAHGIDEMINHREHWPEDAIKMRRDFDQRFAWPIMAQRMLALYETFEADISEN